MFDGDKRFRYQSVSQADEEEDDAFAPVDVGAAEMAEMLDALELEDLQTVTAEMGVRTGDSADAYVGASEQRCDERQDLIAKTINE